MAISLQNLLKQQHILLIQGKMGSFFSRFSTFLQHQGKIVSKINLNAGDAFFYRHTERVYNYKKSLAEFEIFLPELIKKEYIDAVVCFGDCRPHHVVASQVCRQLGIKFFVFEEGYLRPDYITLQEDGINGNSQLNLKYISELPKAQDEPLPTKNSFALLCWSATIYYIIVVLYRKYYPHYQHYRGMTAWQEALTWIKSPLIKSYDYIPAKRLQKRLTTDLKDNYFLVALQVYNDSQITFHSDYADIVDFIEEVLSSFANFAPENSHLVFKHHPLDRAHRRYTGLIHLLAKKYNVTKRVHYTCDIHLPTAIKNSLGMVTINSTTGLQSIYHKKPTKVMGRAIYNIEKLADQQPLDDFWQNPQLPDNNFYWRFREYLIEQTQLNGSFYGKSPWKIKYPKQKY